MTEEVKRRPLNVANDLIGRHTESTVLIERSNEGQGGHPRDPRCHVGMVTVGEDEQAQVGVVLSHKRGQRGL